MQASNAAPSRSSTCSTRSRASREGVTPLIALRHARVSRDKLIASLWRRAKVSTLDAINKEERAVRPSLAGSRIARLSAVGLRASQEALPSLLSRQAISARPTLPSQTPRFSRQLASSTVNLQSQPRVSNAKLHSGPPTPSPSLDRHPAMTAEQSASTSVDEHAPDHEKLSEKEADVSADGIQPPQELPQPLHEDSFPHGLKLFLLVCALELNVFIIALDQTIIAPATPVLSNQFNALADIGWYTSAYLMTTTAMQPLYGRLFGLLNVKLVYLSTIAIFEIGSLICALAQDSATFIVGRAIAGTGLAGGYIGTMIIISMSAPLEKVPLYTSLIGMAYGGGAVVGPIIGGALTSEVTWRWCFYINLPIGGLTAALVVLFLHVPKRPANPNLRKELMRLDIVGTGLLLAAVTCFLLVCQYGGISWSWGDSKTIGLLVGAVLIGAAFVAWEGYWGDYANIPLRLLNQRTIAWGSITNALVAGCYFAILTFMSVWFQAVQGSSAIRAGVQTLPFISSAIFFTIVAGVFTTVVGHYKPPLIFGFVCGSIGCGLLYTLDQSSSQSAWVGYQFLAGIVGASFQLTFVASQTVHKVGSDRERGGSIVIFCQTLGGCLFAGAAQVIYSNKFYDAVHMIPGIDQDKVATAGASAFRDMGLTPAQVDMVAQAAVDSIKYSFVLAAAAAALGAFTSFGLNTNSVKAANAGTVPTAKDASEA